MTNDEIDGNELIAKFIRKNNIEWHYDNNNNVFIILPFGLLNDFYHMINDHIILDEEGIGIVLKDGYIVVPDMEYICDHFEIEINNVFNKEDEY